MTSASAAASAPSPLARRSRRPPFTLVIVILLGLLGLAGALAAAVGPANIPLSRLPAALHLTSGLPDDPTLARDRLVLWSIRLPRLAIAALVGGMLAMSGALMQGLFRNPLADPALVGVSSGGAFAAALTIVLSDRMFGGVLAFLSLDILPLAAFCGSLLTTFILYRIASQRGRTSVAMFLLAGLAIAALANAGIGLLVFMADDRQLRDITFWLLGSLSGATWSKVWMIAPIALLGLLATPLVARGLDILVLGESEAFHAGVSVQRLKTITIVMVSALTGAAVSVVGVVGFVGIVVPHLLRLAVGPGHRLLLPASALLGATLMIGADAFARTLAAPAEVPIGILTAIVGAPFFLLLLLRQRSRIAL